MTHWDPYLVSSKSVWLKQKMVYFHNISVSHMLVWLGTVCLRNALHEYLNNGFALSRVCNIWQVERLEWCWLICHCKLKNQCMLCTNFVFSFHQKTGLLYPVCPFLIIYCYCRWFISSAVTSLASPLWYMGKPEWHFIMQLKIYLTLLTYPCFIL